MVATDKSDRGIGNRIQKIRELKNLTRDQLADKLNMSTSGYSRIERDEVKVSGENLISIADILGVSLDDLTIADERLVFQNFGTAKDQSFSRNMTGQNPEYIDGLYREHIETLKGEIAHLRAMVSRLTSKKG